MNMQKTLRSLRFALNGIQELFKTQPNAQFHFFAGVVVIAAGFYFQLSTMEWVAVVLCIAFVISMEAINTAVEYLTDLVSPEYHPLAGKVKDVAAAAVLIAAVGAAIVGLLIFVPKLV
jgi:diacylglycerol kinase (ATP)